MAEQHAILESIQNVAYVEANRQFLRQEQAVSDALFAELDAEIEKKEAGAKPPEASEQQLPPMYPEPGIEIVKHLQRAVATYCIDLNSARSLLKDMPGRIHQQQQTQEATARPRMALNFGRSISFPLTPARSFSKPRYLRSVSLPGTTSSHPLLANLHAHMAALHSWIQQGPSSSLPSGLAAIQALHSSLADLLLLPESGAALRCPTSNAADRLLDAFLLLADAHQGFQGYLLSLRHTATESRAELRRGDTGRLASAARSQRLAEKELARLAASVSAVFSKSARLNLVAVSSEEGEMAYALVEAAAASAVSSAAVFSAAASMSSAASSSKKTATFIPVFARRTVTGTPETAEATVERLRVLERCLDECDGACDMVFKSVVQTRVSLLNIMTPTI
ncbi:hypothetical protein VPH35_140728 [Triticum aestivum]